MHCPRKPCGFQIGLRVGDWGLRQVCQLECVDANSTVNAGLGRKRSVLSNSLGMTNWGWCWQKWLTCRGNEWSTLKTRCDGHWYVPVVFPCSSSSSSSSPFLPLLSHLTLRPRCCFLSSSPSRTLEMAPTHSKLVLTAKPGQKKTGKLSSRMASHVSGSHTLESELTPLPPELGDDMETSDCKVE